MTIKEIADKILMIMEQSGMIIDTKVDIEKEDLDLRESIQESLQFAAFIMELESSFNISLPDEFMMFDNFSSLRAVANSISELLE